MRKNALKILGSGLSVALSLVMVAGNLPITALAKETDASYVTEGTYQ